jgi:hypothetical protein
MDNRLNLSIALRYLLCDAEAARIIAASRWSVLLGLGFVAIAALARAIGKPEVTFVGLAAPFCAALLTATCGYLALLFVYRAKPDGRGFLSLFGLYAMTAPTGWLLALPGEFLFGLATSRLIDLGILALISTWRVVVVIAALRAVTGVSWTTAGLPILLGADLAMAPFLLIAKGDMGPALPEDAQLLAYLLGWSREMAIGALPLLLLAGFWLRQSGERATPLVDSSGGQPTLGLLLPANATAILFALLCFG